MRDSVVVVGGGLMGCGIAAIALAAGEKVTVVESSKSAAQRVRERVCSLLDELQQDGLSSSGRERAETALVVQSDLDTAVNKANLVIEAIIEDLSAKQQMFKTLDELVPTNVPLCSNTSGLRITEIGALAVHRERIATTHFWFPAHLVPLVEIVMSEFTQMYIVQQLRERLTNWGKAPVIVKRDLPGQLANRILQAVIREATAIVEMDLATPEDVDTAVMMGMGIRLPVWGPLEHVDAVGVDLCAHVQDTVLPSLSDAKAANRTFTEKLAAGELGFKSGKGYYDWSKKDMKTLEKNRNDFIVQAVKFIRERNDMTKE